MNKPAYHSHEEFINRCQKLKDIQQLNVEAFPHKFSPTHQSASLHSDFEKEDVGNSELGEKGETPFVLLAGRLMLFRAMGKNAFGQIQDETGRMQVMFNRDNTRVSGYEQQTDNGTSSPSHIKFIEKKLDLGDIIGIEGHLFRTGKGELTVYAKTVHLLCKSLLPLPDKHCGLADKEMRYRKRWLDLIVSPDVRQQFQTRSRILKFIRNYFEEQDFIEVETPVLQSIYGGAEAAPFKTQLNSLNQEMFLRISLEISLKKLLVGGMGRIFEIGKVFRNEGIDRTHNPEFTMLEAYAPYWDYNDMMVLVETLYEQLALKLFGSTQVALPSAEGEEPTIVDVKAPWKRISMEESLKQYAGINSSDYSDDELRELLGRCPEINPDEITNLPRGLLIAKLFEETVEPHLIQPHHITDHPIETTPLCKSHRDSSESERGIVERFESFINCQEICNAYSELNNPHIQRSLLEDQNAKREAGDEEANPLDEEFIESICQGMPPAGGIGIGIDRLIMFFTQAISIRDVIYFPLMRTMPAQAEETEKPIEQS